MKTISVADFKSLVSRNDWQRRQDIEIVDRNDRELEKWDGENASLMQMTVSHVWGWASVISTLGGITVTYTEAFNYDEYDRFSLTTGTTGQDTVWSVDGVTVVDEDGDERDAHDLTDYLSPVFSTIDYSALRIEQVTDIDVDEDSDMETFKIEIDNAPDFRFTGEVVASVASSDNQAMTSRYSGQTGRWTELTLYKTVGGKFVCHQIGRTRWQGERDRFSGKVCQSLEEVKEFFGHRWLAKELYVKADIDDSIEIE